MARPRKYEKVTPNERDQIKLLEREVERLTNLYGGRQSRITNLLAKIDLSDFRRKQTEDLLREIRAEIRFLEAQSAEWSERSVEKAYNNGVKHSEERLILLGIVSAVAADAMIHKTSRDVLTEQTTTDLLSVTRSMELNIERFIRRSQLSLRQDQEITRLIREGIIEGQTRRETSDAILRSLRKQIGDEKYITINGRNFQPKKYAELLARTRTREITTAGAMNTALQYGMDLMQMSAHASSCPECLPFQGKIYSISGNHPNFPPLRRPTPLHPFCEHIMTPVSETALRVRGELDALINFSNSKDTIQSMDEYWQRIGSQPQGAA